MRIKLHAHELGPNPSPSTLPSGKVRNNDRWKDMPRGKSSFNEAYISSRYKAWRPDGTAVLEVITLTNDRKRQFEAKGWTFKRTTIRAGDTFGSQYQ